MLVISDELRLDQVNGGNLIVLAVAGVLVGFGLAAAADYFNGGFDDD